MGKPCGCRSQKTGFAHNGRLFRIIPFPEYRRPHPHHGGAFFYGFDIVPAHAHGQFGEIFQSETLLTIVTQPPQAGEAGANFLFRGRM
jgi:hypothetical protein